MPFQLYSQTHNLRPRFPKRELPAQAFRPATWRQDVVQPEEVGVPHDPLRGASDLGRRHPIHLCDFSKRRAGPETVLVGHHRGAVRPVPREHRIQDGISLVPREVNINVRWIVPAEVQEALEEQVVPDRVHMRDAQRVRHDRRRR